MCYRQVERKSGQRIEQRWTDLCCREFIWWKAQQWYKDDNFCVDDVL